MIKDYKLIPINQLPIGTEFDVLQEGNYRMKQSHFKVISVIGAAVLLQQFNYDPEWHNSENTWAQIPLNQQEMEKKYAKEIAEIHAAFSKELLHGVDIGYHEMDNSWISNELPEMAAKMRDMNIHLVGYQRLDIPKYDLDIALVAEDGERRFWCHASSDWFEDLLHTEIEK